MGRKGDGSPNRKNPLAAAQSSSSGIDRPAARRSGTLGNGGILPEEMAAIQEISRIVTSTLDIDQVYEKFAAEVKKLVDFDRIGISVIDHEAGTYMRTYLSGVGVGGREANSVVHLGGTIVDQVLRAGGPVLRGDMVADGDLPGDPARVAAGARREPEAAARCRA